MKATSSRRQIIVFVLLGLALAGAALRHWADNPSVARDVGTLLLVLWLPVIGNVVAFVVQRAQAARRAGRAIGFAIGSPFTAHLRADIRPLDRPPPLAADERDCTLVLGRQGFTARAAAPLAQWLRDSPATVELQLLRPELGLKALPPGTAFTVLAGRAPVARGRVLNLQP